MIAGDHDHLDAGVAAFLECVGDFRARWIFKADESGKGHLRFRVRQLETLGQLAPGEGENAQAFLGHGLRRGAERGGQFGRKLDGAAIHRRTSAAREHDLRRTFAIEHLALRRRMHRREPLALRVERDLVHARAVRQRGHRIGGELDERDFHRIAEPAGSGGGARVFQIVAARRHFKKAAMRLDQRGELIRDGFKHSAGNEEPPAPTCGSA